MKVMRPSSWPQLPNHAARYFRRPMQLNGFLALREPGIVLALKIEPEQRAVAERPAQARRDVGCHRSLFVDDVVERLARHAKVLGELRARQVETRQHVLAKDLAGMRGLKRRQSRDALSRHDSPPDPLLRLRRSPTRMSAASSP